MNPLSASEYDRRREFQVAAYIRMLSPSEKIPASWRLLSPPHQGVPDFLTLLFSRRRYTPPEDLTRLRRAWRWMQKTG
jgi:hypothetical protein